VFPDADIKVWMEADLGIRAARRRLELAGRGASPEVEEVAEDLARRDTHDSGRQHSPLKRAPDAVTVDTTDLTIAEQVEVIVALVEERLREINA
jgi:cytidylate kinase